MSVCRGQVLGFIIFERLASTNRGVPDPVVLLSFLGSHIFAAICNSFNTFSLQKGRLENVIFFDNFLKCCQTLVKNNENAHGLPS